jgi:hypothetical protein
MSGVSHFFLLKSQPFVDYRLSFDFLIVAVANFFIRSPYQLGVDHFFAL